MFANLHSKLCANFDNYQNWHLRKLHRYIHWAAFSIVVLFVGVTFHKSISNLYPAYEIAHASPALLQPSDFTYLGYYDVSLSSMGLDNPFGQGLTSRYVNGDFRLLYLNIYNQVKEISITGKNFGDTINQETNTWLEVAPFQGTHNGLWWDEAGQRLWTTSAVDYNTSVENVRINTITLNSNGTTSNLHGPISINGVPAKQVYGGAQPVPTWFQQQYGVGPYAVGWGGYTSILCTGPASLGPTMFTIKDPANYSTEIPSSDYKTIMTSQVGSCASDWYAAGSPTTYDRGNRVTIPENYFDGGYIAGVCGDGRGNGNSGSAPPLPACTTAQGGHWAEPAPDGLGRWVWGDSYYNTGLWIDTPTKQGFIAIGSFGGGKVWYCNSTLCYESRQFELHIFDPLKLGESALGQRAVWNVKPSSMTQLNLPGLGFQVGGDGANGNVGGATFDPVTGRLYMMGYGLGYSNRLYVYQISGVGNGVIPSPTPTPIPTATPVPTSTPTPTAVPTPTPTPSTPIVGDFNQDHIVNSLDWSLMNSKWLTSDTTSDVNHDTIVNSIDFSLMNANWLKTW